MDGAPAFRRLTSTGNVPPHDTGGVCHGGVLTPGSALATVVLREGGSGGAVIATITALANGDSVQVPGPFRYAGQLHATLTGTAAEVALLI
jgi:hypothetical protein